MSKYLELNARNIMQPIIQRLRSGAFEIGTDHKLRVNEVVVPERPWLSVNSDPERFCNKWQDIYFKHYHIISKACRNCWKVMMKPATLKEVFQIRNLQLSMDINAKVGCETRPYTGNKNGYTAVWYAPLNSGLKEGRELFSLIDAKIQALLGREGKRELILKRGCTEMEHWTSNVYGIGSDKWDELAQKGSFDAKEMLLDTVWEMDEKVMDVPTFCNDHVTQLMIDFAFENGDLTYLEYTDNVLHAPQLVTYNDSKHKHQDFKSDRRTKQEIKINYTCSCGVIFTALKIKELDENNRWLPEKNICLCDCGKEIDITEIVKLRRNNGPNIHRLDDAKDGLDRTDSPIIQAI